MDQGPAGPDASALLSRSAAMSSRASKGSNFRKIKRSLNGCRGLRKQNWEVNIVSAQNGLHAIFYTGSGRPLGENCTEAGAASAAKVDDGRHILRLE
jgi:hypothetical protein